MDYIYINSSASAFPDPDVAAYIARVEGSNGDNQQLEDSVKSAMSSFILGCKADGNWDSIKTGCLLSGPRTLAGALQPLQGVGPTNYNFAAGDYDRKLGLTGDGSTKYLDTNRVSSDDPQNSCHFAVYFTAFGSLATQATFLGTPDSAPAQDANTLAKTASDTIYVRNRNSSPTIVGLTFAADEASFLAASRDTSAYYYLWVKTLLITLNRASFVPQNDPYYVFAKPQTPVVDYADSRIAFYSIGEAVNLGKLYLRVTNYVNQLSAIFP